MTPVVRSILCSAALLALTSCGGKPAQNDSANAAGENAAVENAAVQNAAVQNAAGNAAAAAEVPAADPNEKRMVIEALPVAQAGPGAFVGKLHMIRSASGIETDGIGGGCLAIEDPASKVCHADSDCKVPSYIPGGAGPFAYCADQKCWIKPADRAFCWKSRYSSPPQPLQVGQPQSTPPVKLSSLPAQLFQGPAKDQVRVRVIACLSGKFDPAAAPPCAGGGGKRSDDVGEARTLTK